MSKIVDIQRYIDAKKGLWGISSILHPAYLEEQKRRTREICKLIDSNFAKPKGRR